MTATTKQERLTFSVKETAQMLGISDAAVYAAVDCGAISHIRIGGRILVPANALQRLVDGVKHDDAR